MWHRSRRASRERFTVVCTDLRGYGDSSKPDGGAAHVGYSKRAMAADQVEVMRALGFARFRLAGHDRGGRVAHRLCLDHPEAVERVAVLDISPTRIMYAADRQGVRDGVLSLVLPDPAVRPPRAADRRRPDLLPAHRSSRAGRRDAHFDPRALAEYERCFATRRRSTRPARTIAPRPRSISSTTRRTRSGASSARCSCCGGEGRGPPVVRAARRLARRRA